MALAALVLQDQFIQLQCVKVLLNATIIRYATEC